MPISHKALSMADAARARVYRADHCGSLLRPPDLREARRRHALGQLGTADLQAIEDRAVLDVIGLQRSIGLPVLSDGEFRRKSWHHALETAFSNVVDDGPEYDRLPGLRDADLAANPELAPPNPVVTGRLGGRGRVAAHEAAFLGAHTGGTAWKITLPSPAMVTRRWLSRPEGRAAYPDYAMLIDDVSRLLAAEASRLADEGVPYIQVDAPGYRHLLVRDGLDRLRAAGIDPQQELDMLVAADNRILRAAKRPGNTVAVHICHGTFVLDGRGAAGGGPVDYLPGQTLALYERLQADVFLIEYTQRGGGPASLRGAPHDRIYALGLLNIRDPQVEKVDDLMRRIDEAAKVVPPDRLALCPNCGFSGMAADAWVTPDIQKRKLEVVVRTAERVWGTAG